MAVRLFAILARRARRAVVFRRGPSRRVLLIDWRTDRDLFTAGQWFKGRIYERRCDLSPGGHKLAYFAASWRGPYQTWTAISKPPWLTAVALFPKGDAWGGGALFDDETHVRVNHFPFDIRLADGFKLPKHVKVTDCGAWSGRGEDFPIWHARLVRDGWKELQSGVARENAYLKDKIWFVYDPPQVWWRASPKAPSIGLEILVHGIKETDGPWYVMEHVVSDTRGARFSLGEGDWADWDANGDLLFARAGRIFRAEGVKRVDGIVPREIADLRGLEFEAVASPPAAKRW